MKITDFDREQAEGLLSFIDASPSPWHAIERIKEQLHSHGFSPLEEKTEWNLVAKGRYYVVRGGSSVVAFIIGDEPLVKDGFNKHSQETKKERSYHLCNYLKPKISLYMFF